MQSRCWLRERRTRSTRQQVVGLTSFLAVLMAFTSKGFAAPIISIDPATTLVRAGEAFNLNVLVGATDDGAADDVSDLFAYQFGVVFNPLLLNATHVSEGPFLSGAGETFFIPGVIDNVAGEITFNANTLIGPGAGVTGAGSLLNVAFLAVAPGTSPVSVVFNTASGDALFDSAGIEIVPFSTVPGDVTVAAAAAPEPGTLLFIATGFAAYAVRRKRRVRTPAPVDHRSLRARQPADHQCSAERGKRTLP